MIRRASIPGARPPPRPPSPAPSRAHGVVERAPLARPGESAARLRRRQPLVARRAPAPSRTAVSGGDEGGEHRHQRHLVHAGAGRTSRPGSGCTAAPARAPSPPAARAAAASAGVLARLDVAVHRLPRARAAARRRPGEAPGTRSAAPCPRRTYTSTSETRTEVMGATARRRPAARCPPAATSRGGTAPRSRCPAPRCVGKTAPYVPGAEHRLVGQVAGVVAVHVVEELRRPVEAAARASGGAARPP